MCVPHSDVVQRHKGVGATGADAVEHSQHQPTEVPAVRWGSIFIFQRERPALGHLSHMSLRAGMMTENLQENMQTQAPRSKSNVGNGCTGKGPAFATGTLKKRPEV